SGSRYSMPIASPGPSRPSARSRDPDIAREPRRSRPAAPRGGLRGGERQADEDELEPEAGGDADPELAGGFEAGGDEDAGRRGKDERRRQRARQRERSRCPGRAPRAQAERPLARRDPRAPEAPDRGHRPDRGRERGEGVGFEGAH